MSRLITWDAINFYVIAKFISKKACKLQAFFVLSSSRYF